MGKCGRSHQSEVGESTEEVATEESTEELATEESTEEVATATDWLPD